MFEIKKLWVTFNLSYNLTNMSAIFSIDGFDAKRFSSSPSEPELFECIDSKLLDEETKHELMDRRIFFNQEIERHEGIIDHLIFGFSDKGPLEDVEREALKYLKKLSEYDGNLVEKYGQSDPYFFGYLTSTEVESLYNLLSEIEFEESDYEEEKELLQTVLEKALAKKTGIVYSMLP